MIAAAAPPGSVRRTPAADAKARRVSALITAASIEILPREELAGAALRGLLPAGAEVFVNHPVGVTHHDVVAACTRLRRAGFVAVPHIAARHLASYTQADDFLRRAVGEAEIDAALLVGGDAEPPVGPFRDSADLLATGLFETHGLRRVGFAGHPEGHKLIAASTLGAALRDKIARAREAGLAVEIITQFGFDAPPILDWIAALRRDGIVCPVRVGIAGPASVAALAKVAVRGGVGASLGALVREDAAFARTQAEAAPDGLIRALVDGDDPPAAIERLHLYPFGGLRRTVEWASSRYGPR